MTNDDRVHRAKQVRYRKAALALIQRDYIDDMVARIAEECDTMQWAVDDDVRLADVFDGDTDEMQDFRFCFSDMVAKCERLGDALRDNYVTEHFDDFFVGALGSAYEMVGYDSVEEDYYHLTRFDAELAQSVSGKRLMALTKEKIIAVAGQCVGIMMCFLDLRHSYDALKTTFDLLRDEREELMGSVDRLVDLYERLQADPNDYGLQRAYDAALVGLPERVWVE